MGSHPPNPLPTGGGHSKGQWLRRGLGAAKAPPARALAKPWQCQLLPCSPGNWGRGHSGSPLPAAVQEELGGAGGSAAGPRLVKQPPRCGLCQGWVLRCCGTHRTCAQVSVPLCPSPGAAHLPAPADASGDAPRLKPPAAARLILQLPAAECFLHVFSLHLPQNRAPPALLRFAQRSLTSPHCLHH